MTAPLHRFDSINIGLGQREGVAQQLNSRLGPFRDDDFDDVEPEKNVGIIEEPEPRQTAAGNSFLLVAINGVEGTSEIFARPCFHLDENEGVAIAADNVDLAAGAPAEITIQDFVTAPFQELAGQLLPARSKSQMPGRRIRKPAAPPVRKIGDESDKVRAHAI
jgi:hypothetical protein